MDQQKKKLRMEMVNVFKGRQADQRPENSPRLPIGLQNSEKNPAPGITIIKKNMIFNCAIG